MESLLQYALQFVGRSYHWGGDDPIAGFDCSGFVLELLKSVGEFAHSAPKMNAQLLYHFYETQTKGASTLGALAFFGKDFQHVSHIAFCISDKLMLEAGGGDSTTLNDQRAIAQNAFVRMRPILYRKDFLTFATPTYKLLGTLK